MLKRCQLFPDPLQCFIYLLEYIYQHYEKKRISGKNYFAPYYSPQYFSFFFVWVIYFWYIVKFQEYFKFFLCVQKFSSLSWLISLFYLPPKVYSSTLWKKKDFRKRFILLYMACLHILVFFPFGLKYCCYFLKWQKYNNCWDCSFKCLRVKGKAVYLKKN